jgi:ABC-type multidrug transport system permease subunit
MMFLSGTFIPLATYPFGLQVIARFLPLTYSVEGLQNCVLNPFVTGTFLIDIAALTIFTVVFLTIATAALKRSLR